MLFIHQFIICSQIRRINRNPLKFIQQLYTIQSMEIQIHHLFTKKRSLDGSSINGGSEKQAIKHNYLFSELYNKFMTINKQITIQHDITAFNMAQYQKQDKLRYDQQMVQAKLKRLENNAELKRANQELQNRNRRISKRFQNISMKQEDSYLNIYKQYATSTPRKLSKVENDSESEQQGRKQDEEDVKGISYYSELRKHPRLLQFTIQKLKSKELAQQEQKSQRKEKLDTLKKQIKNINRNRSLSSKAKLQPQEINPQQLADNIFRKIYTKKNKEPPIQQAKTDERIAKMIHKQDSILDTIDQRSLSKENYKKLRGRLNDIANELYKDDKKHEAKIFLPKIKINNVSSLSNTTNL